MPADDSLRRALGSTAVSSATETVFLALGRQRRTRAPARHPSARKAPRKPREDTRHAATPGGGSPVLRGPCRTVGLSSTATLSPRPRPEPAFFSARSFFSCTYSHLPSKPREEGNRGREGRNRASGGVSRRRGQQRKAALPPYTGGQARGGVCSRTALQQRGRTAGGQPETAPQSPHSDIPAVPSASRLAPPFSAPRPSQAPRKSQARGNAGEASFNPPPAQPRTGASSGPHSYHRAGESGADCGFARHPVSHNVEG